MEKFEVFNRDTGKWEKNNIQVVSGWAENWVQDRTTDTLTLKVKYKSETAPNWNCGDWCRFLHGNTATYKAITGTKVKEIYRTNIQWTWTLVGTNMISVSNNMSGYETISPLKVTIEYKATQDAQTSSTITFDIIKDLGQTLIFTGYEVVNITLNKIIFWVKDTNHTYYIPDNHEQFIIGNCTYVKNEISGEWDCQLSLKEPIEMANGISVETRSFTNQVSKVVSGTTYYHEAFNHLNVLELILKTTPANNDFWKSWFTRIGIAQGDLLENKPFNDETFSEQTLYGILMDKYDSSLGRTPVLYFEIDNETDLPVNLEKETYILDFLRQDGFDKDSIELDDLLENNNEYIINKSDDNFADGIVSNYDNLSIDNDTYYPSENYYATPEVDTNERPLTSYTESGTGSKWILRVPHSIKKILSVVRYKTKFNSNDNSYYYIQGYKETFNGIIYEEKQYNAEADDNKRASAIWFTEGNNIIHLNEMAYPQDIYSYSATSYIYCIQYVPLVSARFDLAKDYQIQLNQNDSQVDSDKFGDYIKKYFNSMNKADLIIAKTISNFSDIVEIGTQVIDDNGTYLITNVSIQNRGFDYDVVYQLNKNHFRKSDSIVASQEIRKNIEIGIDATKERKSMLPFEYKISLSNTNNDNTTGARNYVVSALLTDTSSLKFIQGAYLDMMGHYLLSANTYGEYSIERCCEVIRYVLNNTFCFNMKYFDNAEAGKTKTLRKTTNHSVFGYGEPKAQMPVLYTNYFGEIETFDIDFIPINSMDMDDFVGLHQYPYTNETPANNLNAILSASSDYPLATSIELGTSPISVYEINYYKDMLDTFNYTIGFHMDSDEQIILCKAFFNNSILIEKAGAKISAVKTYSQNMQEIDYAITNYVETSNATGAINGNEITITLADTLNKAKSVILVDSNDNPILIINDFDKVISENTFNAINLYC